MIHYKVQMSFMKWQLKKRWRDTWNALWRSRNLEKLIKSTEISVMLSNPDDASNAIVSIHPGAGGTESQDWASIFI